ncbi:helix-turn-helix domain-containing protein [Congregibacter brevis]|uniref:Helix-turn-helix domain-containing protein n=1 Tax=Congregibacter brevis TaxID=3081201 RepID=A0ABZ0I8P1_9GAMM|nr:helix-turn-helix domain-containing protein [Congregibacter sp. IMCC45268]
MSKASSKVKLIRSCSIWRALEIVGDTPTLLILESYWLGARRFDEFCKETGLLKTVVSDRLKRLVSNECMIKVAYSDNLKRFEYRGTEKFVALFPLALAMLNWERKWSEKPDALSVELTHKKCGQLSEPEATCKACHALIRPEDVIWSEGPGAGFNESMYRRRRRQTARPVNRLLDDVVRIIGDRWATLILRSLFSGVSQFQEILTDTAIATNILSARLSELSDAAVICSQAVPGDSRRIEYRLTDKGLSLFPIIVALMAWGDEWLPTPNGAPQILTHQLCEHPLKIKMACSACREQVHPQDTVYKLTLLEK